MSTALSTEVALPESTSESRDNVPEEAPLDPKQPIHQSAMNKPGNAWNNGSDFGSSMC